MRKYNKIFKNRQILTSEEMNGIVDVINDIISQFNEANSDDRYFRIITNTDTIEIGKSSAVTVRIEALDGAGDIRNIKIYWDKDGYDVALNKFAETVITVPITETTTFRATLVVADSNNPITKSKTIRAINPTYVGSGELSNYVVDSGGPANTRTQSFAFPDVVRGEFNLKVWKGEHVFFFVPSSVEFDVNEIYLDSILFPMEYAGTTTVNGGDYIIYRSSGGIGDRGFEADVDISLEAL